MTYHYGVYSLTCNVTTEIIIYKHNYIKISAVVYWVTTPGLKSDLGWIWEASQISIPVLTLLYYSPKNPSQSHGGYHATVPWCISNGIIDINHAIRWVDWYHQFSHIEEVYKFIKSLSCSIINLSVMMWNLDNKFIQFTEKKKEEKQVKSYTQVVSTMPLCQE